MLKLFSTLFLLFSVGLFANDKDTIKVKAERFVYKAELSGIVLSNQSDQIKLDAENWQNFKLIEAAEHGQMVKKGEVIASFDKDDFNEAVSTSKRNLEIQKANLHKAKKLFEISMEKMAFERKKSQLAAEAATKLALIYKEKGHEQAKINYEQDLVDARNSLEYQKEELSQLKKMYDEDKITEETEEIVLKRQQNYVESLTKRMKSRELAVEEALNVKLPGELFNAEYKKAKALLDEEKNKVEWEIFVLTERLKLEGLEAAFKKASERHEKLVADEKCFEIKAEGDGQVFYGSEAGGKWANQIGTEYKKGKSFLKGAVLFNLIDPKDFVVKANANFTQVEFVGENDRYFATVPGAGVKELKLTGKKTVPNNGSFGLEFKMSDSSGVFNGINCKVQMIKVIGDNVIAVPEKAIHTESEDPTKQFVNAVKEGKTEKVYVTTVLNYGGKTIVEGLSEGMEIKSK